MSKTLMNEREIHISSDQVRGERMLENVRMPFLRRQASSLSARSKDAEESRTFEFAPF